MRTPASDEVWVRAPGKINLGLSVGPRDDAGFHPLMTVFQAVGLYEDVRVAHAKETTVEVEGPQAHLVPRNRTNLAMRAAKMLAADAKIRTGVRIRIDKEVPVAGGMGGGSADAAATLVACDELWGLGYSRGRLRKIAAELGADVAFPLLGNTAVGSGYGADLAPAMVRGSFNWLILERKSGLSTPKVYAEFDALAGGAEVPDPAVDPELMKALLAGDARALGRCLHNDLQDAAVSLDPDLETILARALDEGALGAIVSGSGPTVAVLAESLEASVGLAVAVGSLGLASKIHRVDGPVPGARVIADGSWWELNRRKTH